MKIIRTLSVSPLFLSSHIMTIGHFDGIHLGHQAILKALKNQGKHTATPSAVLTFQQHASTVLKPEKAVLPMMSLEHKLRLLEQWGIDLVILLSFTSELARLSAEEFLKKVQCSVPFHQLVLGYDAVLGRNREGTQEVVKKIGKQWGFDVEYLPPEKIEGIPISSSLIREAIRQGNLNKIKILVGRPYSVYGKVIGGKGEGKRLGFATANLPLSGLCTPPYGVYAVTLQKGDGTNYPGVANLGVAPTLQALKEPVLETHLFNIYESLYGEEVEVFFHHFIRPEQTFASLEALKVQIGRDIQQAKDLLS